NSSCIHDLVNLQYQRGTNHIRLIELRYRCMFNPFTPVENCFGKKFFCRADKWRLKRFAVCENKIACITQHKELFIENIADGNVGGQANFFITSHVIDVIASAKRFLFIQPVLANGFAFHTDPGSATDRFELANNHQGFKIAIILIEPRSEVSNTISSVLRGNLRAEDVAVLAAILVRSKCSFGEDGELAALAFVEEASKHKRTVKPGPA